MYFFTCAIILIINTYINAVGSDIVLFNVVIQ